MYQYIYMLITATILMDILNGSFSSFLQRQTFTMGTTGTLISDMWSENFRNLHAYASFILFFFH